MLAKVKVAKVHAPGKTDKKTLDYCFFDRDQMAEFFFFGSLQVYFVLSNLTPLGLIWSDYIAVIQLSYHYHLFRL